MKLRNFKFLAGLLALVFLLSACNKSLVQYQQAIKAFNQGATLEINQTFKPEDAVSPANAPLAQLYPAEEAPDPQRMPDFYFQKAYQMATQATKGEAKLKETNSLGSALTLAALAAWKTGHIDEAIARAGQAQMALMQEPPGEKKVRDLALSKAIPGLIVLSQLGDTLNHLRTWTATALPQLTNLDILKRDVVYKRVKASYVNNFLLDTLNARSLIPSITLLNQAMAGAKDHPQVQQYLVVCQLTGLANWLSSMEVVRDFGRQLGILESQPAEAAWHSEQMPRFRVIRDARIRQLESITVGPEASKLLSFWKMRLGMGG